MDYKWSNVFITLTAKLSAGEFNQVKISTLLSARCKRYKFLIDAPTKSLICFEILSFVFISDAYKRAK